MIRQLTIHQLVKNNDIFYYILPVKNKKIEGRSLRIEYKNKYIFVWFNWWIDVRFDSDWGDENVYVSQV